MTKKFDFARVGEVFEADWPVTVNEPKDGGGVETSQFMARFRIEDEEVLLALGLGAKASKDAIRKVWVGFGKGETAEFSDAVRDWTIAQPFARLALTQAYIECSSGIAAKNSETPPD